jgi:hypothetical protein
VTTRTSKSSTSLMTAPPPDFVMALCILCPATRNCAYQIRMQCPVSSIPCLHFFAPSLLEDISRCSRSPEAASTLTPWWGLPFLFFEYLLFALLGPGPARATLAKSAIMATRRMTSFILIVDGVKMLCWESCKRQASRTNELRYGEVGNNSKLLAFRFEQSVRLR